MADRPAGGDAMGRARRYHTERPDNVEISRDAKTGATYFRYVFPDGKRKGLGSDQKEAFAVAEALNGHFKQDRMAKLLKPKATTSNPSIDQAIDLFHDRWVKHRKYSARSRSEIRIRLNGYREHWAGRTVQEIGITDLAEWLNACTPNTYPKHRTQLTQLFQFFASQGWIASNIAQQTMPAAAKPKKVRQRHTLEGLLAVRNSEHTEEWLRQAIDTGLYTLQRESDLVAIKRTSIDPQRQTITVLQKKTENYANPVHIEIELGAEAWEAISACYQTGMICPFLIHRRPKRITGRKKHSGTHPFQVDAKYLSKAFTKARDASGAYDHLEPEERPTFHEIRALGIHLLREAGYSNEYIMSLSGHADERMLEGYDRDHAVPVKQVRADLSIRK